LGSAASNPRFMAAACYLNHKTSALAQLSMRWDIPHQR
jgi:hypothetical protein